MGKQSPVTILFCLHFLHSLSILYPFPLYPCLNFLLRISGESLIVVLPGESFKIGIIWKLNGKQTVAVCFSNRFIQQKFIWASYQQHVLQSYFEILLFNKGYFKVTSRWYAIFSYCPTLWLVKCETIYTYFENNYMLWSSHYLIFS